MKKFMTLLKNIRFTQQTPTQFLLFVSLYALALAMWAYYFPAIVAAILVLFFVVICALRWRVTGGVLSSLWGTALMTVSYFTHQHSTLRDLIVGSSAYFVVGIGLGTMINLMESQRLRLEESESRYRRLFEQASDALLLIDSDGMIRDCNPAACRLLGYSREELLTKNIQDLVIPQLEQISQIQEGKPLSGEWTFQDKNGRELITEVNVSKLDSGLFLGIGHDITERKQAETQIQEQLYTLSILYELVQISSESLGLKIKADIITRSCVENFGVSLAWIGIADPDGQVRLLAQHPTEHPYPGQITARWDDTPEGQGPTGRAIRSGTLQIAEEIATDPSFRPWSEHALQAGFFTSAAFPLISRGHTFGALNLYSCTPGFFRSKRLELFQAIAHHAASALENARLFEETERRFKLIQALRNIDMAITGSLGPHRSLSMALEEIVRQLEIDAASILRFNPSTKTLVYAAGHGFHTHHIEKIQLQLGESIAGQAALERRLIVIHNISEQSGFTQTNLFIEEGFVSAYAMPLVSKDRVLGVIGLFHRSPHEASNEWLEFLETLAGQTAIAIDNDELFHNLERANVELLQAYDVTIEGWAYVLDLKDEETEGHSRRVTELTLRIAREMGIKDEELGHIRRGALLHDIGKMGIPDAILQKSEKLTDEEWEIMRKHPVYAYQMLSRIEYLHPALDIPYCHHEKWDGTGYPQGLKEDEIPLSARIFTVVDVFDALTHHRPYREAWPKEKVLEYYREQRGKHFGPRVVDVFLALNDFDSFNKKKQEESK